MDNNIIMAEAPPQPPQLTPLAELVASLEQATLMAKQITTTADPTCISQILSSLQQAHHHLSSFLSNSQIPNLPHPLQFSAENSLSSSTGAANDGTSEPMQVGNENDAEPEENSKTSIDRVEERMRECFIRNKRAKRPLSPSAAAEERRVDENGYATGDKGFGPQNHWEKLKALDLIYQFHG